MPLLLVFHAIALDYYTQFMCLGDKSPGVCASWIEQIVHSLSPSVFQRWSTLLGTESFWHPVTVARTAGSVLGISLSWLQVPSQGRCFCMAGSLTPKDILWSCVKFKYVHYIYSIYYEILQICFLTWFFFFFLSMNLGVYKEPTKTFMN